LSQSTRVTDRRTDADGRTDRILLAIPRLHYMQRGKNVHVYNSCPQPQSPPNYRLINDCLSVSPTLPQIINISHRMLSHSLL